MSSPDPVVGPRGLGRRAAATGRPRPAGDPVRAPGACGSTVAREATGRRASGASRSLALGCRELRAADPVGAARGRLRSGGRAGSRGAARVTLRDASLRPTRVQDPSAVPAPTVARRSRTQTPRGLAAEVLEPAATKTSRCRGRVRPPTASGAGRRAGAPGRQARAQRRRISPPRRPPAPPGPRRQPDGRRRRRRPPRTSREAATSDTAPAAAAAPLDNGRSGTSPALVPVHDGLGVARGDGKLGAAPRPARPAAAVTARPPSPRWPRRRPGTDSAWAAATLRRTTDYWMTTSTRWNSLSSV